MHSEQFPTRWLTVISDPSGSQTALSGQTTLSLQRSGRLVVNRPRLRLIVDLCGAFHS